jgi:hypothetical protein
MDIALEKEEMESPRDELRLGGGLIAAVEGFGGYWRKVIAHFFVEKSECSS